MNCQLLRMMRPLKPNPLITYFLLNFSKSIYLISKESKWEYLLVVELALIFSKSFQMIQYFFSMVVEVNSADYVMRKLLENINLVYKRDQSILLFWTPCLCNGVHSNRPWSFVRLQISQTRLISFFLKFCMKLRINKIKK